MEKLFIRPNGPPAERERNEGGPFLRTGRMGSEYPDAALTPFLPIAWWTTYDSPSESPRTPEMLYCRDAPGEHAGSLMAEKQLSHDKHTLAYQDLLFRRL